MDMIRSFSTLIKRPGLLSSFVFARRMKTERIYGRLLSIFEIAKKKEFSL
jgi:hypothetical protein